MKRFTMGLVTALTGALIAACGSTAPTTGTGSTSATTGAGSTSATTGAGTSATTGAGTSATTGAGTSATTGAGTSATTGATTGAGSTSATTGAGTSATTGAGTSATSAADDMSATTEADTSATSAAGTRATSAAGDTSATSAAGSTTTATGNSLVDTLSEQGNLTTLVTALQATGLDATLSGAGEFTVFAPTDEAFASLPAGTLEALLANPELLTQILSYHVVEGTVPAADLAGETSVTTLEGQPIQVSASGSSVTLNENTAVTTPDLQTSNGTVHVIDKVLLPPNVTLPAS